MLELELIVENDVFCFAGCLGILVLSFFLIMKYKNEHLRGLTCFTEMSSALSRLHVVTAPDQTMVEKLFCKR